MNQLIPGFVWRCQDHQEFLVKSDGYDSEWNWRTCLGVALSIAGALTLADRKGFQRGWFKGAVVRAC